MVRAVGPVACAGPRGNKQSFWFAITRSQSYCFRVPLSTETVFMVHYAQLRNRTMGFASVGLAVFTYFTCSSSIKKKGGGG